MSSYFIKTNPLLHIKLYAVPAQAWTGPEGSRNLGLPNFMTVGK
jgi:hypothetical protein